MEKKIEATMVHWGYIGIMEKNMETTVVYWVYMGIMEKKMESTIIYGLYIGIVGYIYIYLGGSKGGVNLGGWKGLGASKTTVRL